MEDDDYILGIDFGTTFSCVGVWIKGSVLIIPNRINERTTPSVVVFDNNGDIYVGEETINRVWNEDAIKIYEIKRLIGKKYSEVENIINYFSYKVIKGSDDEILINLEFKNKKSITKSPIEIASLIFKKLITNAEHFLHKDITQIIVTVPADFSDRQRSAIKSAAEMIKGLKVKKVINEPSAAVLCYGFPKKFMKKDKSIINKDLPSKKENINIHPMEEIYFSENMDFDQKEEENKIENDLIEQNDQKTYFKSTEETKNILVFDLGGGTFDVSLIEFSQSIFETLASAGDSKLGGGDFDNRLMEFCLDYFCEKNQKENFSKEQIKKNIKCLQRLKMACEQSKKYLSLKMEDTIYIEDFYNGMTLNCKITRSKFEEICKEDFNRLKAPLDRVLSDQNMEPKDINEIVLVGGSSKIPYIKQQILKDKFPNVIINDSINPEEAVAYGATIFAESERRKTGDFWEDFDYLDSIQHSYGIEIDDGKMEFILRRGSKYPTSNTKYFFTAANNQKNFEIKIYEGESQYVIDNEYLDKFIVEGIPRKKKGEVCLTITFSIDFNQILNVTGYVAEGDIKKVVEIKRQNKKYVINTLLSASVSSEINKKEKQVKEEIIEYSKKFVKATENKDKLILINKYNEAILFLLQYLAKQDLEVYFNFIQRLFQSYVYVMNSDLINLMSKEELKSMNENIQNYFKKVIGKNPFKLKVLLEIFKKIDNQRSKAFYFYSIQAMDYLIQFVEKNYFPLKGKNNAFIAESILEEILSIANENLYLNDKKRNDDILDGVDIELKLKFKDCIQKCQEKLFIISAKYSNEIKYTKQSGKLFSNDDQLDNENLALISSNLFKSLKDFENIDELGNNKEKLELGSICYANLVKVEFLKEKNHLNYRKLLNYANKSIKLAENLGENQLNSEWYREIVKLKDELEKKIAEMSVQQNNNLERIRQKFQSIFDSEELVKYLLRNYPCEGYQYSEEKMKEFKQKEKIFLKKLNNAYKKATKFVIDFNEDEKNINDNFNEIKQIILEFINNMINRQQNQI